MKRDSPKMLPRERGAFDHLVLQNQQLSKDDRLSAEEVAKEIRKASRNPNAGPEPPPKEEPFDLKDLLGGRKSSHQSSQTGSVEGLRTAESDR